VVISVTKASVPPHKSSPPVAVNISDTFKPIETIEIKKTPESVKVEEPIKITEENIQKTPKIVGQTDDTTSQIAIDLNKPYEEMTIKELQEAILEKMRKNGPITDYMLGTVKENVYRDSLINWVKSFN